MCQEIMAPQVEYGEETLAPTEADETQQQTREIQVLACLSAFAWTWHTLFVWIWMGVLCTRSRKCLLGSRMRAHVCLPKISLCFMSVLVSASHIEVACPAKTKLRGLIISSECFVSWYLARCHELIIIWLFTWKTVSLWTEKNSHTQMSNYGQQHKPDRGWIHQPNIQIITVRV